ncbi:hypothetical protein M3557_04355 [Bhargavaea ginsengi]|uniref:hypothetical protein n=1 Tax=Bhargavaea ginsengi TaxID=426757 RepID=UPI00203FC4DE|nr:hypothetical protein [Bhargavaea ginsengi]MCM3087140.1 hypothetical protein [Bhargavaea ginsengi]
MNERTYTQEELNEAIKKALAETRKETAAAVEKASQEGEQNATDYKAEFEKAAQELEKLKAEQAAVIAEHEAQAKREAIVRAFFSGDSERQYRQDAQAVEKVLEWFDVDTFADVDEAKKVAFSLKLAAPGIMQEIRKEANKKQTGGLFRRKGRS